MKSWLQPILSTDNNSRYVDIGILVLRLGVGLIMALSHGWMKITDFSEISGKFLSFLGLNPTISLGLSVFAEFFCSLGIAVGFLTRLAAFALIINMYVAAFVALAGKGFQMQEIAVIYLVVYVAILLVGGGRYSLDHLVWRRRN